MSESWPGRSSVSRPSCRRRSSPARRQGPGDWALVYVGNLIGALSIALMVWLPEWWKQSDGAVGATALSIAAAKTSLPSGVAFLVGLVYSFVYLRDRR